MATIQRYVNLFKEHLDDYFRNELQQYHIDEIDASDTFNLYLNTFIEDDIEEEDQYKILMEYGLNKAYKNYEDEYETVNKDNVLGCLVYYILYQEVGDPNEFFEDFKKNRLGEYEFED